MAQSMVAEAEKHALNAKQLKVPSLWSALHPVALHCTALHVRIPNMVALTVTTRNLALS